MTIAGATLGRWAPSRFRPLVGPVALVAAVAWLLGVTIRLASDPVLAFCAAVAPIVLVLLVRIPLVRLVLAVGGGLVVLGGSADVGPAKIGYAALLLLCTAVATVSLTIARPGWARQFRILILPGAVFAGVLLLGLVASPTPFLIGDAVRGGIFWLMILTAPILGLDAAQTTSPRAARAVVAAVGLLSALGFATEWLAKRGATSLRLDGWVAGSLVLPIVAFALAFVQSTRGDLRYRWLVWAPLATGILIALLITGTRTNLIILVAIVGTLGSARSARVPLRRAAASIGMIAAIAALSAPVVVSVAISNPEFIASRMLALTNTTSGGLSTDASFVMRQSQAVAAQEIVNAFPLFGYGAGWIIPSDQIFDTPWVTVVRIGWLGVGALVLFLGACAFAFARSGRRSPSSAHAVASGVALTFLALLGLLSPVEDHFFGFALALLFLLIGSEVRERAEPTRSAGMAPREDRAPSHDTRR